MYWERQKCLFEKATTGRRPHEICIFGNVFHLASGKSLIWSWYTVTYYDLCAVVKCCWKELWLCSSIYEAFLVCFLSQRRGLLVDHSSSLQTEVWGWKGSHWWWSHFGQCVLREIPGEKQFILHVYTTICIELYYEFYCALPSESGCSVITFRLFKNWTFYVYGIHTLNYVHFSILLYLRANFEHI